MILKNLVKAILAFIYKMGGCICYPRIRECFAPNHSSSRSYIPLLDNEIGLLGPQGTRVNVEGMYIELKILNIFLEGIVEGEFFSNLSGRPMKIRKCIKLLDSTGQFMPSAFYPQDLDAKLRLISNDYQIRLYVIKDRGYFYTGKILLLKEGTVVNLIDFLQLCAEDDKTEDTNSPLEQAGNVHVIDSAQLPAAKEEENEKPVNEDEFDEAEIIYIEDDAKASEPSEFQTDAIPRVKEVKPEVQQEPEETIEEENEIREYAEGEVSKSIEKVVIMENAF